jgi:hypothetical protein
MVLLGGYAQGRRHRGVPGDHAIADAFVALMRQGWGDPHSAFMRA